MFWYEQIDCLLFGIEANVIDWLLFVRIFVVSQFHFNDENVKFVCLQHFPLRLPMYLVSKTFWLYVWD
jgi:hypothetical protein